MKIRATEAFLELFPEAVIGLVHGEVAGLRPNAAEELERMTESSRAQLRTQVAIPAALNDHPHVTAWREAYRKFGARPKDHRPTHEAYARQVLRGDNLPAINTIVDIYLVNQTANLLPHGGYDVAAIVGDLVLDVSPGGEWFEPLGGGDVEVTAPGEVVYRDARRILTRRWNHRDCDATRITHDTRSFLLMIEAPSASIAFAAVEAAACNLADRYSRCFHGSFLASIFRPGDAKEPFEV